MDTETSFAMDDIETVIKSSIGSVLTDTQYNPSKINDQINSIISATRLSFAGSDLKEFGPLLVSLFKVHEDFSGKNQLSFDGKPEGKFIGRHAMTMIGHRKGMNTRHILYPASPQVEVPFEITSRRDQAMQGSNCPNCQ